MALPGTKQFAVAAGGILLVSLIGPVTADAQQGTDLQARSYSNCTELNRDFKHGVSDRRMTKRKWIRKGATGKGAYKPRLYRRVESSMDRDNDHIACEK